MLAICTSHSKFNFVAPQATLWEWLDGPTPGWTINVEGADVPVSSLINFIECLIECCSCAPSLSFQVFFPRRSFYLNALTGTILPQISTLTKLSVLYAPKMEQLLSVGHVLDWVLVLRASLPCFQDVCFWHLDKNKFNLMRVDINSQCQEVCFHLQGPLGQQAWRHNPSHNINTSQADFSVRPHVVF